MEKEQRREIEERIRRWIDAAESVPREAYTFVADPAELPAQARAESMFWAGEVFLEGANPYNEALGAKHAFVPAGDGAIDLLRHELSLAGLDLVVIEGRNFGLVEVSKESLDVLRIPDEEERKAEIDRIAEQLFQGESGPPRFCTDARIDEGCLACSNPEADPLLITGPREREEAGIRRGSVFFLYYKRVSQLVGFLPPRQWFEEASGDQGRHVPRR